MLLSHSQACLSRLMATSDNLFFGAGPALEKVDEQTEEQKTPQQVLADDDKGRIGSLVL